MRNDINMTKTEIKGYSQYYSEESFWDKILGMIGSAGEYVIRMALVLYYELQDPTISFFERAVIYGALGYLILPADLIPDFMPLFGYTDDIVVLKKALDYIDTHVTEYVEEKVEEKMQEWF